MTRFLVLCMVCAFAPAFAQPPVHTLKGRVVDGETGLPLSDVRLFVHETEAGTLSDSLGRFVLSGLAAGRHHLHVERIGYRADAFYVNLPADTTGLSDVRMMPTCIELRQVLVEHSLSRSGDRDQPLSMATIGSDDLDRMREVTLAQSLTHLAGVQVIQTGVSMARPVIRGFSGNRILVQDLGMKQEGQQWGSDHGLELDPWQVERMEVIRGPGTLTFGPDAMGGVLHILPPSVPEPGLRGTVHTFFRSANGLWGTSVMTEGNRKGSFFRARFTIQEYGDYRVPADSFIYLRRVLPIEGRRLRNTAGREMHGALTLGHAGQRGSVKWTTSVFSQEAGLFPGIVGVPTAASVSDDGDPRNVGLPRFSISHIKSAVNAVWLRRRGWLQADVGVQQNIRAERIRPRREGYGPLPDTDRAYALQNRTAQATVRWHAHANGSWKWMPGASVQVMDHSREGYELLLPAYLQWMAGVFLTTEYRPRKGTTWSGGIRYDAGHYRSEADSAAIWNPGEVLAGYDLRIPRTDQRFGAFSGGLGWSHSPAEAWVIKWNAGKSFRPPNAAERSINGVHHGTFRHEQGDGSLRPEHGYQLDAAVVWERSNWLVQWSPFASFFSGYIYLRPSASFSTLQGGGQLYRYTQHDALFTGGELQAEWHPADALHLELAMDYVFTYNLETGLALPFSPPFRTQAYAEYEWKGSEASARVRRSYLGVRITGMADQWRTDRNENATPGFILTSCQAGADIRLGRQVMDIRFVWSNVLNTRYMNHLSIYRQINLPEQGSNVSLVVRIPFEIIQTPFKL